MDTNKTDNSGDAKQGTQDQPLSALHMAALAETIMLNDLALPLVQIRTNGDEVEISRAPGQVPPAAWESIVVTGKARAAIRRATRRPTVVRL